MILTAANYSLATLRACDTVALGVAARVLRDYGHTPREFFTARPELWRPEIPAEAFRAFLAGAQS